MNNPFLSTTLGGNPSAPSVFSRYRSSCAGTETNKKKDTKMTSPKQIRCIAIATLAIGIVLAVGSVWFNREARLAPDAAPAQRASSAASMLFTLAGIFILIGGYEFQRARTVQRLNRLELEIELLKGRGTSSV
jgi:hypothetical protein